MKFYPYPTVDDDQIFAAAGEREVFVCRMVRDADRPFQVLRWLEDEDVSLVLALCETGISLFLLKLTITG